MKRSYRWLKRIAIELALTCIYVDPLSERSTHESRMYCSHCTNYREPGHIFHHQPGCLVGMILTLTGDHVVDEPGSLCVSRGAESYIEYQGVGNLSVRMTHEDATRANALRWGGTL